MSVDVQTEPEPAATSASDDSGRVVVTNLSKQYGTVQAVRDLSFTVEPGQVTGFLGPNGAGKTTTLRAVLGLVRPTGGTATVNGLPYRRLTHPARVVGAVLGSNSFHPARRARAHLRVYTAAIGVPDGRADGVLAQVGLTEAANRKVGGFSLGMRQRLALATALLGDPQVLLLDEPSSGLDPEGVAWLRAFLRRYAATGRTVLVSSHHLAEMAQTVDRVVIISRGTSVYEGTLDGLPGDTREQVRVLGDDPAKLTAELARHGRTEVEALAGGWLAVADSTVTEVGDLARSAGVAIYGIAGERLGLEEQFLRLTDSQYRATPTTPDQEGAR